MKDNAKKLDVPNIAIENARIGFRNFSGKEGKYNSAGNRNFTVFLETDIAQKLVEDGWNVRWLTPKEEDDAPQAILQVKAGFGNYPPKIVVINGKQQSELNEATVHILDWAEIENVDLIIRPYNYNVQGKTGVKAHLKTMYVTLVPDPFSEKYGSHPDSGLQCTLDENGNCID